MSYCITLVIGAARRTICQHRDMLKRQKVLAGLLYACVAALPQAAAQDAQAVKKGLFWKATSGTNTIYLLGSIHLGSKDMYPLPKEFEDAYASSRTLVVEVDLNKVDMQKMQAAVFSKGLYGGGDSLWEHVSPETRRRWRRSVTSTNCQQWGWRK